MKSHYRGHKMAIWLNLIPQLHQPGDEDVSMRHHHFHERADKFYQGIVQPESLTRPSPRYLPASPQTHLTTITDCLPGMTEMSMTTENDIDTDVDDDDGDEVGILQRLADSGYHSYAAALGVTVGVGCLLLILNLLIFAGIYYQRGKNQKGRKRNRRYNAENVQESDCESSQTPAESSGAHVIKLQEPPPCYTSVATNTLERNVQPALKTNKAKEPPTPPMRTCSNVKKRVGKTALANFLYESYEKIINVNEGGGGDTKPTKAVRILEFFVDGIKTKNVFQKKIAIELWDCSGGSRYQSCWPAIQHEVQGIIFVHTDNLPEEVSSLRTLYHHFVEETNFPESRCLVVKNQTGNGDDLIIEKNPLPNLNHVVANYFYRH
ncbi:hypothetical protein Phum_PHUM447150 [Pediculus humanus corporis]|uniref:Uncharacterized protein n=1 Tax=Pediculus humanus subsp. corporis TaxID=121224 RepID=E0VU78_PEDHC|nr:uncharacterized protein Phum_PHUM447150 [Pediculus humanus corporis]EEB16934.1 hypothetical protein Phum_PHUM447150 [Pediculus humanus corporis]